MAILRLVQQHGSICRAVLVTVFLEFTIVNQCTSNQEICITSNRSNISYFQIDIKGADWHTAWQKCFEQKSVLPVICDKNEQNALANYLNATLGSSAAWTSGKKIILPNWTWINGQSFIARGMIASQHESYTHVALDGTLGYSAQSPQHKNYYLCHYSGPSCNSGNVIKTTKGCVRPSGDYRSWFDARNQCLTNGGDLAILDDDDLATLRRSNKLDTRYSYWIGLRSTKWYWIWQEAESLANSSEDVKYSNWSNETHSLLYDCISIDASSTGDWKAVRCMDRKKVVCQTRSIHDMTSTTMPGTMSNTTTIPQPITLPILLLTSIEGELEEIPVSKTLNFHKNTDEIASKTVSETTSALLPASVGEVCVGYATFMSVVIVGICVIVISNVIVAFVVRKVVNRNAHAARRIETNSYQDLDTTRRQVNPDRTYAELQLQPVYEDVCQRGN